MTVDEQKSRSYVWVEPNKIPDDRSNDPDSLGILDYFCPTDYSYVVPDFQKHLGLPNPRPVYARTRRIIFLSMVATESTTCITI